MKLKELQRTVNVSWSPPSLHPILLATGTAAQQVDASFSSNSHLDIYSLNLEDPSYDLELKSSLQTQHKFQKLVWSGAGVLVGGCDGGVIHFYNADRLIKGSKDSLIATSSKHNGNVSALDVNPFQKNLLSSGASDSEIYIWDLNNTASPMAPGNKSPPNEHVQDLAWNQQVQHILASTFATRCVVWDLRKNEPIMKLSDAQSRTRWRSVVWHPSVATQLCVASEDDQVPVVQLWDLRLAASPLVTLERHQKGVMALSWCKQDPDLLLSAGKDGTVLCWNPNNTTPGGELLCEVSSEGQWVFDVSWCPRNPCLVVSASFDGHVNVHSINGGTKPNMINNTGNIMDSFPGMDKMSQVPVVQTQATELRVQQLLPRPPRWNKRPIRARMAFGGKLVTFDNVLNEANPRRTVQISQVITDPEIIERANELDSVLGAQTNLGPDGVQRLAEYCRQRGDSASDQNERYTWFFLKANFEPNFRSEILNLLGFRQDEITSKFKGPGLSSGDMGHDIDSLTSGVAGLSRGESTETEAELSTDTSTDLSDANTLIARKLLNTEFPSTPQNINLPTGDDLQGLICRALVCGNLEEAVELCLEAKRVADALIIASLGSQELLNRVQKYYLSSTSTDPVSVLSRTLLLSKWSEFVDDISLKSWREALATIVTHCDTEVLAMQCELLGSRLSKESDPSMLNAAILCYLCSASVDVLVSLWQRQHGGKDKKDLAALARLVELALLARKAAVLRERPIQVGGKLESLLSEYAMLVACQGHLQSALNVLECVANCELRERLQCALLITPIKHAHAQPKQANAWNSYNTPARSNNVQYTQRKPSLPTQNNINDAFNASVPSAVNQPWSRPAPVQQTPGILQPAINPPPAAQPPRPSSTGPQPGGVTARAKRVVDPSVKSGPSYGQYNFNNAVQSTGMEPSYGNYSAGPVPAHISAASVPSVGLQQPGYNPPGYNPAPGYNPPAPVYNPPVPTFNPPAPGFNSPNPGFNPPQSNLGNQATKPGITNGGYYNPAQFVPEPPAQIAPPPVTSAPPGWNDPPMMTSAHKPQPKKDTSAPAPITHPLFGVEPQHIPLTPTQGFGQNPTYGAPQGYDQQFQQGYQQFPSQMSPAGYQQQQAEPAAPAPEPVAKQPIPDQHLVIQTVFDALRAACVTQAHNPQTRRKLEDVQKRLETLYDLLRENRLSENALSVLHAAVQQTQTGDYNSSLATLTSLAVGPDFASVASFLPGLKVLIQVANQGQVYLR